MNHNRIAVDNLSIDITRRCNLTCKHCMRGEAESKDISYSDLDMLFSLVYEIYELQLTGGEPALCVPQIQHITQLIREHNIKINHFSVFTNGQTNNTDDFIHAISDMCSVCVEPSKNTIAVSVDYWHGSRPQENDNYDWSMRTYLAFKKKAKPYFHVNMQHGAAEMLKLLGRAKDNHLEGANYVLPIINEPIPVHEDEHDLIVQQLAMTAKGNLRSWGDHSYIDEDLPENSMCHISEIHDCSDLLTQIDNWNRMESVRVTGTLFTIARRIKNGCLVCSYFEHTYFSLINLAATIIDSEEFTALPENEKTFLLDILEWENHKSFAYSNNSCSLHSMCGWWESGSFQGNAFQTFMRIASIQARIYKKKDSVIDGKNTD